MLAAAVVAITVITSFCVNTQKLCFYPKNEPPGCVVLTRINEGRKNRCLQLTNWYVSLVNQK